MTDTTIQDREHSSIVGGSNAGRMLHCPGHYGIIQRMQEQLDAEADKLIAAAANMPPAAGAVQKQKAEQLRGSLNKSSSYADEGTALHTVMEYLIDNDVPYDAEVLFHDVEIDRIFEEHGVHDDRFMDAVLPAYKMFNDFLDKIMLEDGCDEALIRVESKVELPGIEGAFGTADVLIRTSKRTVVWDWKFGAGVPVAASYTVQEQTVGASQDGIPAEELTFGNDQLTFYARAALNSHPEYFDESDPNWKVHLVICQPRTSETLSEYEGTIDELEEFLLDLLAAVDEAVNGEQPALKIGKWCNFAACKAQCPLHLNGPVALAQIAEKLGALKLRASQSEPSAELTVAEFAVAPIEYAEALATMLDLAEIVEPYIREAQKQAHEFMEAGGIVPHYKLVPKRAGWDSWEDDAKAEQFLARQGLSIEERRKPMEPITPAKARTALKALKDSEKALKLLEKYVKPGVSSGTTIAPETDGREAVKATATTIADMAEKLKQIGVAS